MPLLKEDYQTIVFFIKQPFHTFLMILWIGISLYHGQLGLQVIVEDYVHHRDIKTGLLLIIKGLAFSLGIWGFLCLFLLQIKTL